MIRVTVWNEFQHERTQEKVKEIYPDGIHTCIAKFLRQEEELSVRTAVFDEKEHGLTEEVLAKISSQVCMIAGTAAGGVLGRCGRAGSASCAGRNGAGSSAFRALFQDYAEASRNKYDASVAAWGS